MSIQPRPTTIRDVRSGGFTPAERANWQRITQATAKAPASPTGPDAPQLLQKPLVAAAQSPSAVDIAPLSVRSPRTVFSSISCMVIATS